MKLFRRYKLPVVLFLIPAICLLLINSSINSHLHQLTNGFLVSHAHPFEKANQGATPFQSHKHTESEFLFLDLITNVVLIITVLFALLALFLLQQQSIKRILYSCSTIKEYYFVRNYHAPPV